MLESANNFVKVVVCAFVAGRCQDTKSALIMSFPPCVRFFVSDGEQQMSCSQNENKKRFSCSPHTNSHDTWWCVTKDVQHQATKELLAHKTSCQEKVFLLTSHELPKHALCVTKDIHHRRVTRVPSSIISRDPRRQTTTPSPSWQYM